MELYNLYSYIETVDEPDTFLYLFSARFDNDEDAEASAYNETCLRYEECENEYRLPTLDDIVAELEENARKNGKSAALTKEMYRDAIEISIDVRNEYIDSYAIRAIDDDRNYEDIFDYDNA
jgi:hypothetical protein